MGGAFSSDERSKKKTAEVNRSKAQNQITDIDRTILDLKNARDRLTKYNAQLDTSIEKLMERAKAAKEANRMTTALGLLRLKKYKQAQVESVQTQLLNVHQMIQTIDSQQQNTQIVNSLKAGKEALAKIHKETTVEDILTLMDEISEQIEVENEVAQIINGAVANLTADQEEAAEAELAAMVVEMGELQKAEKHDIVLPEVPTDKLPEIEQPTKVQPQKQPERVAIAS